MSLVSAAQAPLPLPSLPLFGIPEIAMLCGGLFREAKARFESTGSHISGRPFFEKYFVSCGMFFCCVGAVYNLYLGNRINQAVFLVIGFACGGIGRYLESLEHRASEREGETEELKKRVVRYETALEDREDLLASLKEAQENQEHLSELVARLTAGLNELATVSLFFQTFRKDLQTLDKSPEMTEHLLSLKKIFSELRSQSEESHRKTETRLEEIKKILGNLEKKGSDIHRDLLRMNNSVEELHREKVIAGKTILI